MEKRKPWKLRSPCNCGSTKGWIQRKGTQDCVYCEQCKEYQYCAPKSETQGRRRTEQPRDRVPFETTPFDPEELPVPVTTEEDSGKWSAICTIGVVAAIALSWAAYMIFAPCHFSKCTHCKPNPSIERQDDGG